MPTLLAIAIAAGQLVDPVAITKILACAVTFCVRWLTKAYCQV
jgi:hypothetical protein